MTKIGISVIINTLNEEKYIKNCLESVKWADEILLVDMYSEDKTVEIAKRYTDRILYYERIGYVEPARKFAFENTLNEWVLIVDADELVPKKLKERLIQIVEDDLGDIINIPHNNYFFGKQMNGAGWGPLQDKHHRFYKKTFVNLGNEIHSPLQIKDNARIYDIEDPEEGFIHFNYIDFEHFVEKMNNYTTIEAKNLYEDGKDINFKPLVKQLFNEFRLRYFNAGGRKDGFRGFSLSLIMVIYRLLTYSKLKLMRENNSKYPREKILEKYQNIADEVISEYSDK
ncbi:glycosyltransferase family 2 protein [Methanobacterium sp. ACI-7]|uniref:glycosyltransferase family 2 protein n=1 Tax=unclassified Methanobacterium TaxID=2627676 RepID=UPI0039C01F4E